MISDEEFVFDDEFEQEGPDFQAEMGAYGAGGRVGFGDNIDLYAPQTRLEKAMMDPLDRFKLYVDATSRELNNWDGVNLTNDNIQKMLDTASRVPSVHHKNPTAFVLGFLATGGGVRLTKSLFDNVVDNVLPHVHKGNVTPPDVLRYARLWQNL